MASRRLSVRALWGFASWALPLAVVFFVTPMLLDAMGPERFGVLMISLVTPLIAAQLDFGIALSAVRRLAATLAAGRVEASTLLTIGTALALCGLALGSLLWIVAVPVSDGLGFSAVLGNTEGAHLMRLCGLWGTVTLVCSLPGLVARATQSFVLITLIQTAATATLWIGALVMVRANQQLADIVLLGVGLNILFAIVTAYAIRRRLIWRTPIRLETRLLLGDWKYSMGMFVSQIASTLVYQFDRVLIAAVGSPALAGAYALCINLANKLMAAVVALTAFVFPHASGLHVSGGRAAVEDLLHALDRSVIVLVVPVVLPGCALAGSFLSLWVGEFATPELSATFRLLWLAFAIASLSVPVGNILAASGQTALAARFAWLTAAVVVTSIVALVPRFGLRGAGIGVLLGMATSLLFNVAARRSLNVTQAPGRLRFWVGITCGVAAQAVVLWLAPAPVATWLGLIVVTTATWSAFYIARVIFGMLSPEEARLLKGLAARPRS